MTWDKEYNRKGIPSSHRDEPSGVLVWALAMWPFLSSTAKPHTVLDVGTGTGRNALYLAGQGFNVTAFDSSRVAIEAAKVRFAGAGASRARILQHDLVAGLPVDSTSCDLVCDIFVYKHQLADATRAAYRAEVARVLRPDGLLLMSLAGDDDGYYGQCPTLAGFEQSVSRRVLDPIAGIGSVLFSLPMLTAEMGDQFELQVAWIKRKPGRMHDAQYDRVTLATLWRRRR